MSGVCEVDRKQWSI